VHGRCGLQLQWRLEWVFGQRQWEYLRQHIRRVGRYERCHVGRRVRWLRFELG